MNPISIKGIPGYELDGEQLVLVERYAVEQALSREFERGRMAGTTAPRRMISAKNIAEALAISESKAWKLLSDGVIPSFKLDGNVRCWLDDFEAWATEQARAGVIAPNEYQVYLERCGGKN